MTSLAMRWPTAACGCFARVLVASASTAAFATLLIAARIVMWHTTWPSRSYMLMVAAKLALAWLLIRRDHLGHPQRLHRQAGVAVGVDASRR